MKFIRPTPIEDNGGSFSRASSASYIDSTGTWQTASTNVLRTTYFYDADRSKWLLGGALIEPARTNLLLNSSTLSTQSVTISTAGTYAVSFYGTGTLTLTGILSDSLVGTHTNVRVSKIITLTTGTLTLTVSGSVTHANLELGDQATSWIPTTGSTATRAEDICTGTGMIYSNIPETDYAAWSAGTAYVVGNRVIRTTVHAIYERVVDGTTPTAPESDPANWIYVGPTNKWAAFDDSPSTLSSNSDIVTYVLKPGRINSVALLEVEAVEVAITLSYNGEQVFFGHTDLLNNTNIGNWYEYFYEPFYYQTTLALTDLVNAAILDLPQFANAILTVTLTKPTGTPRLGVLACGIVYQIGNTQNGISLRINDYSRKDTDSFGNTILVRRKYSKRAQVSVFLYSSKVDVVSNLLTQYRATPVVWIAADAQYSALVIYGFYRDWDIGIPNNIGSLCTIEIEGLT